MVATSVEEIRLQLRSWPEVEAYLEGCKGVIVPLGSTEQHGPTGAIGTDALTAGAVALEVGRRTGVLVTPAQAFGMAEHHLGFPGTMSLQPATLLAVMHDLVMSLARHGFERVYVINGHGGNIATTKAAFAQAYGTAAPTSLLAPMQIARRAPGPTDVAMEILYCGVCHSDVHTARGEWPPWNRQGPGERLGSLWQPRRRRSVRNAHHP